MNKKCGCGREYEDGDGWPGSDGIEICLYCWENECSKSWWVHCAPHWIEPEPNGVNDGL